MHILYVSQGYKPAYRLGGPIWSVAALAERMKARGHRVTVFTTNSNLTENLDVPVDQPVLVDGVEVWYFRQYDPFKKALSLLPSFRQSTGYMITPALSAALRNTLPSVNIVHTQMPYIYPTRVASRMAIAAGTPLFYSPRNAFKPTYLKRSRWKKSAYLMLIEKPILRQAAGLVALTPEEVEDIRLLGLETPCHLVPNGIDTAQFRRVPRVGSLDNLGILPDQKVLLFLGRLQSSKSLDLMIDAYAHVAAALPDTRLVIAGPDQDGLLDALRNRAAACGLSQHIIFPGTVTGEPKIDLLARADLFVLPSRGEGISMAVLEALASGTPAVLSRECNMPVVDEWGAGAVVERNVDAFAQAIIALLRNPEKLAEASDNAFRLAGERYSWKPIIEKLEAIYVDAIAVEKGKRGSSH